MKHRQRSQGVISNTKLKVYSNHLIKIV